MAYNGWTIPAGSYMNNFDSASTQIYVYADETNWTAYSAIGIGEYAAKMPLYDSYSIRVIAAHNAITQQDEAAGFCIEIETVGFSCGAQQAVSGNSVDTYKSYWLDATYTNKVGNNHDLVASAYNANIQTVTGLTAWSLSSVSNSKIQGDKWQPKQASSYYQDYRIADGTTIKIHIYNKSNIGAVTWASTEGRTLQGALSGIAMSLVYIAAGVATLAY